MIQNLNRGSFQPFGSVLSPNDIEVFDQTLYLTRTQIPVYRATSDTYLQNTGAMTVLAIGKSHAELTRFYLDKPVCIQESLYFCLIPLMGDTQVQMRCQTQPTFIRHTESDLQPPHPMQVKELYTFFYQEKEQGFMFSGENHPVTELTYVDQGSMHSVVDGQDLLLEQGDIAIYAPGQWHMQYADMGVAPRFVTISFSVTDDALEKLKNRKFKAPQKAVTLLQTMLRETEKDDEYAQGMILALLTQLLLVLLRQADGPTEDKLRASNAIHSENEIIRRAQQYISSHVRDKLTVPVVAANVEVSASYLTALFHKNLQLSPGEYIRRVKLQESKLMIRENAMNFTEIAATLQYSTVHHFSRQFKEKFGITPSEYAKSVR
jgi:AraC-like DNA-binding protein